MSIVPDFYANRAVLVTGASGFLGKVIVEKLLRSTPQIENIYLLIRPQKGLDPKRRLVKLLESNIFDCLRASHLERFEKLIAISGDLMKSELALSQPDMRRLCDEVSVVFHCAATVKFDEALRISVEMNVVGTQRLIALCHKMRNLVSVVHASTAYANCDRSRISETIYPAPIKPSKLIDALDWMTDEMVDELTPHLLGRRPNTYTLTKSLAEVQLSEDCGQLPVVIVRPSIIGAVWKEPIPGWTDNLNGPTGIFAAVGKGVLTNMCGSVDSTADIIPVDVVSNLMIIAAWQRANNSYDLSEIPVIHCCSGRINPIKWNRILEYLESFYRQFPIQQCYRMPSTRFHSSRTMFELNFYAKHQLPAYVIDLLCIMTGRKPKFCRIYEKVWRMVETLHYFTTRGWDFQTKLIIELWEQMSTEDQQEFDFDIRQLSWDQYLFDYLMGIKKYIVKEDVKDWALARNNLNRLRLFGFAINASSWALLVRLFAAKRSRNQKWSIWLVGTLLSHFYMNFGRPSIEMPECKEEHKLPKIRVTKHK